MKPVADEKNDSVRLPEACRLLKITYNRAYHPLIAGAVPAVRDSRGWSILIADLPALHAAANAIPTRNRCTQ